MVPSVQQLSSALQTTSLKHGEGKAVAMLKAFMEKNHLLPYFPAILDALQKRNIQEELNSSFSIVSATDLSESAVDRLSDMVHQKTGEVPKKIEVTVDKSLVGGFIGTYKGTIFDGSVITILNSLLNKK